MIAGVACAGFILGLVRGEAARILWYLVLGLYGLLWLQVILNWGAMFTGVAILGLLIAVPIFLIACFFGFIVLALIGR